MKKGLLLCQLLLPFILFMNFCEVDAKEFIILSIGEQKILQASNLRRVVGGNKNIVEIIAIPSIDQVHLTGKKNGSTDFTIWENNNKQRTISVKVILPNLDLMEKEIRQRLKNNNINGVKIKKSSRDNLILFGTIKNRKSFQKFSRIVGSYEKSMLINDVEVSSDLINVLIKNLQKELRTADINNVSVNLIENNLFLEGEVKSDFIKNKALKIAYSYIKHFDNITIQNFITVGVSLDKMVIISVDFVELDKATGSHLGLKWGESGLLPIVASTTGSGGFGAGTADSGGFAGLYKITGGEYLVTLNALKNSSRARILDRPKLICRSGDTAQFHSGETIALAIKTDDTASVEYKKIGVLLNIKPVVDRYNNIKTTIEIENSTIGDAVEGNMNFPTSRVETTINLKNLQTIVLSGLESKKNAKEVIKFPLLGDIPIIGELFKSRLFSNKNKELMVFLTPEVVIPKQDFDIADDHSANENHALEIFNNKKEKMKFSILD